MRTPAASTASTSGSLPPIRPVPRTQPMMAWASVTRSAQVRSARQLADERVERGLGLAVGAVAAEHAAVRANRAARRAGGRRVVVAADRRPARRSGARPTTAGCASRSRRGLPASVRSPATRRRGEREQQRRRQRRLDQRLRATGRLVCVGRRSTRRARRRRCRTPCWRARPTGRRRRGRARGRARGRSRAAGRRGARWSRTTVAPPASSLPATEAAMEPLLAPVTTATSSAQVPGSSVTRCRLGDAFVAARPAPSGPRRLRGRATSGLAGNGLAGADEASTVEVADACGVDPQAGEILAGAGPAVVDQDGLLARRTPERPGGASRSRARPTRGRPVRRRSLALDGAVTVSSKPSCSSTRRAAEASTPSRPVMCSVNSPSAAASTVPPAPPPRGRAARR